MAVSPHEIRLAQKRAGIPLTGKDSGHATRVAVKQLLAAKQAHQAAAGNRAQQQQQSQQSQAAQQALNQVMPAVRLKYGPTETSLGQQITGSDLHVNQIGDYFKQYQDAVNAANTRAQSQYQQATDRLRSDQGTADASDAKARSGITDPGQQAIGTQAAASRKASLESQIASMTQQGLSQGDYLSNQGLTASQRGQQAQQTERGRGSTLRNQLSQTKQAEGDYATQLEAQAAKDALNAQIAQQGLGIKLDSVKIAQQNANTAASTAQSLDTNRKATVSTTRRGQTLSHQDRQRGQRLNESKDAYQRRTHTGPYKLPTPPKGAKPKPESQGSLKLKHQIESAMAGIRLLRGQHKTGPQITAQLQADKVDPVIANAARDLVYLGYLSGPNIAALKRIGVRIPAAWTAKPRPAVPTGTPRSGR